MNIPNPGEKNLFVLVQAIRDLINGGTNALGTFTLTAGGGTTQVKNPNVTKTSRIVPVPTSAGAATAIWYLKSVDDGSFTVGHATADGSETFNYEVRKT